MVWREREDSGSGAVVPLRTWTSTLAVSSARKEEAAKDVLNSMQELRLVMSTERRYNISSCAGFLIWCWMKETVRDMPNVQFKADQYGSIKLYISCIVQVMFRSWVISLYPAHIQLLGLLWSLNHNRSYKSNEWRSTNPSSDIWYQTNFIPGTPVSVD